MMTEASTTDVRQKGEIKSCSLCHTDRLHPKLLGCSLHTLSGQQDHSSTSTCPLGGSGPRVYSMHARRVALRLINHHHHCYHIWVFNVAETISNISRVDPGMVDNTKMS